MSYPRRRLLYTGEYVAGFRKALNEARGELAAMSFRHACAVADLRKEVDEVRAAYNELRDAVLERQRAEAEVEMLRREHARITAISEGRTVWLH
jgi:hypothetical protein